MPRLLTALLMLAPLAASAQSGTVQYSRAIKYEFTLPPGVSEQIRAQVPTAAVTAMVLRFTPATTLLTVAPKKAPAGVAAKVEAQAAAPAGVDAPRGEMLVARLKMASTSRADHESMTGAHTDLASGVQLQSYEFMTRTFLVSAERPSIAWKLTTEQSIFLGHPVLKATATHEGRAIEAWFAPQIPVQAGPGEFGGLPGLILAVTVDAGQVTWSATAVDLETPVGAIAAPTEGQRVTRAEYERIVEEKLVELRQQVAGRRGDRIP